MKNFPEVKFPNQPVKKRTGDDVVDNLADLKSPARDQALKWFASNPKLTHPRRGEVASALVEMLKSPFAPHDAIGDALAVWASKDNTTVLIEMVAKRTSGHQQAMMVLAKVKEPAAYETIASRLADFSDRGAAGKALTALGTDGEGAVLPYLFHDDSGVRQEAKKILEAYGTKEENIRAQAIKELQGKKKLYAAAYLGKATVDDAKRDEVSKAIEPLLQDTEPNVRSSARQAFFAWAGKEQVPQLIAMLHDEKSFDRNNIIAALARFKEDRVAEALAQRLPKGERSQVGKVLLDFGAPLAEKHVLKYLHHPDHFARMEAERLLKALGTNVSLYIDRTLEDVKSADMQQRRRAVDWLVQARPEASRQAEVVQALNPLTTDGDVGLKNAAVRALKNWGGTPAIGTPVTPVNPVNPNPPAGADIASLIKTVETPGDMQARHKAMDALAQMKDPRGAEAVAKCLMFSPPDRNHAANTLKAMGPVAEGPACFALLNSPDSQVRIEASRVLAAIGTRNSLPVLQKATFADAKNKSHYLSAMKSISSR